METNNNLNIVLIGMMGGGKSYIGNKLAKLLVHFKYIDIDKIIEERTEMTISEIFEKKSEYIFRKLEAKTIKEFAANRNQIISLGGGAFETPENIEELKKSSLVFYLKAPAKELYRRLKNDGVAHRPLLKDNLSITAIEALLRKREKNYFKADFVIDTYEKPAYTILDAILGEYDNYVKQKSIC